MEGLLAREATLLSVLSENVDRWGDIKLTMVELVELTGSSRTTLWRALTKLNELGLVQTTRTKRNLGKLYKNRYRLGETSTAGQGDYVDLPTTGTVTTEGKNTSYSFGGSAPAKGKTMVNKWSDDDEGLAGFGLLEEKTVESVKVKKNDPKTRYLRPQNDWTAWDVASEFAVRAYDVVRGTPGIVNTKALAGALRANRSKFGITAEQEMALLDKFFADTRNHVKMRKFPKGTHGMFLNFITNHISDVSNLVTVEDALALVESLEYIIASDGRKFDNSMPGRAALERYEEKLKGA